MEQFELIAKTFQGLEEVLAQELTELGANDIQIGRRMVSFSGDKEMMYRANFCLRTAVRILKPIKHFKAADADDVYNAVRSIEWDQYLDLHNRALCPEGLPVRRKLHRPCDGWSNSPQERSLNAVWHHRR